MSMWDLPDESSIQPELLRNLNACTWTKKWGGACCHVMRRPYKRKGGIVTSLRI